jgi:hypothetical protein
MTRASALLGFAVIAACYTGPSAESFAPARGPRGVAADLRIERQAGGGRLKGELLAVQDTSLLVLREERVVLVPLRAISIGSFRQVGSAIARGRITTRERDALRQVSRFPDGLSDAALARLLQAHNQSTPDTPSPSSPP